MLQETYHSLIQVIGLRFAQKIYYYYHCRCFQRLPNLTDSPEHFVHGIPSSEDDVFPVSVAAVVNAIYRQRLCCGGNIPQLFSLSVTERSSANEATARQRVSEAEQMWKSGFLDCFCHVSGAICDHCLDFLVNFPFADARLQLASQVVSSVSIAAFDILQLTTVHDDLLVCVVGRDGDVAISSSHRCPSVSCQCNRVCLLA